MVSPEFPLNRYKHLYSVGLKMYSYARNVLGKGEVYASQMFMLGNLHDIGYFLDPDAFDHDWVLAHISKNVYKYHNEIKYHSRMQREYWSEELDLLYFADMTVDGRGSWCTFEERLKDLEIRYGIDSEVYKESYDIVQYLHERGFDDSFTEKDINIQPNLSEYIKKGRTSTLSEVLAEASKGE